MAESHGTVYPFAGEEVGHGGAHDVAAANHHAVLALGLDVVAFEQGADAHGGGGEVGFFAQHHASDVHGGESVNILIGVDGVDDALFVDVLGEWELDDEAVDFGVVVEEVDGFQQGFLGSASCMGFPMSFPATIFSMTNIHPAFEVKAMSRYF